MPIYPSTILGGEELKAINKALLSLFTGVLMIAGLSILMPEMIIGIIVGYSIGITSLVLTSEMISKFEQK